MAVQRLFHPLYARGQCMLNASYLKVLLSVLNLSARWRRPFMPLVTSRTAHPAFVNHTCHLARVVDVPLQNANGPLGHPWLENASCVSPLKLEVYSLRRRKMSLDRLVIYKE